MGSHAREWRDWALPTLAGLSVIAFASGSSSIGSLKHDAHGARWVFLFALLVVAAIHALPVLRRRGVPRGLSITAGIAGIFELLAILSTAWSPVPGLTFERGVSLCLLFATSAAIAVSVDGDAAARRRLFVGLAGGAGAVAAIGLLMLAVGVDAAAQPASHVTPWRFRGFGENPNTIPVLGAVALPIVTWLWLTTTAGRSRALWAAAFASLLATAVATQSRGGLVGAFIGVALVLALLIPQWPRKVGAIAALGTVIAAGVVLREATQPPAPAFYSAVKPYSPVKPSPLRPSGVKRSTRPVVVAPGKPAGRGSGAKSGPNGGPETKPTPGRGTLPALPAPGYRTTELPPREDEIGFPTLSRTGVTSIGSGRVAAWEGALRLVKDEPLLGYGFGTESRVFVDRWYYFEGSVPENSTLGILLQLGVVGLGLIVALLALLLVGSVRALKGTDPNRRDISVVGIGVLAGAIAVTFIQSYIYSVGNVASATVWITAFVLGASVVSPSAHDET